MDLIKKLQIPDGTKIYLVNLPGNIKIELPIAKKYTKDVAVLVFAADSKELDRYCKPAIDAAQRDRICWIAYPKAKQLNTDLNRDKLWQFMKVHRIEAVRLVSMDDVWSAMRFRPAK